MVIIILRFPSVHLRSLYTSLLVSPTIPGDVISCYSIILPVHSKLHSSPEQHQCGCHANSSKPQKLHENTSGCDVGNRFSCDLIGCGRFEFVSIQCEHCHGNFCITHRHSKDHNCTQLPSPSTVRETKKGPLQDKPHERKGVGRRSEKCSQLVAMMRLKQTAKGPSSVAQSYRVYYNVTLPNGDTKPMYFSKVSIC